MTPKKVWVALLSEDGKEILLGKRAQNINNPSQWNLFGGGIQNDEIATSAGIRELSEETGLYVNSKDLRYCNYINGCVIFAMNLEKQKAKQLMYLNPAENSKARWFPLSSLPDNLHYSTSLLANNNIKNGKVYRNYASVQPSYRIIPASATSAYSTVHAYFVGESIGGYIWGPASRMLYGLKVHEPFRGLGISRMLLDHATQEYRYPISLTVAADGGLEQLELQNFYSRYGFKETGERRMMLTADSHVEARMAQHARLQEKRKL